MEEHKKSRVSIVIPVFNEAENLETLCAQLAQVLGGLAISWEVILVDDGSSDASWSVIEKISRGEHRIKGLRFSRNFGHQYALLAGLLHAEGSAVITMDADLQHPPSLIPQLIKEWEGGQKIVNTLRIEPQSLPFFKKITSRLFYSVFAFLSGIPLESGMADFRLLDRQVVDAILQFREQGLFLRGIVQLIGYSTAKVEYQCQERYRGKSKYTLGKMIRFAWNGITSFSLVPLRISIVIGVLTSLFAFYQLGEAIYVKLFTHRAVPGWASAFGLSSLMFGLLFIFLGILGEYIGRILIEARGRPRYLITQKTGSDAGVENR